jgi:hypothetical protein
VPSGARDSAAAGLDQPGLVGQHRQRIPLLSIGLFRSRTGPRWVGPVLWAFLGLEFAGGALSPYPSCLAILCFAAAFLALARVSAARPGELGEAR